MGSRALYLKGFAQVRDDVAPLQQGPQTFDDLRGPLAKVSQGALAYFAGLSVGLAQENGRGGVAIGDGFDVHGHHYTIYTRHTLDIHQLLHGYTLSGRKTSYLMTRKGL